MVLPGFSFVQRVAATENWTAFMHRLNQWNSAMVPRLMYCSFVAIFRLTSRCSCNLEVYPPDTTGTLVLPQQAVRNQADLATMACPPKYRQMQTFYKYYTGACALANCRYALCTMILPTSSHFPASPSLLSTSHLLNCSHLIRDRPLADTRPPFSTFLCGGLRV